MRTIRVRRVQKRHAKVDRAVNSCSGLLVIAPAVKVRHAHTAEAEGGNVKPGTSELAELDESAHAGDAEKLRHPTKNQDGQGKVESLICAGAIDYRDRSNWWNILMRIRWK